MHVVVTEMLDGQRVAVDRVRFPAVKEGRFGQSGDRSLLSEFARMTGGSDKAKPVAVDRELRGAGRGLFPRGSTRRR